MAKKYVYFFGKGQSEGNTKMKALFISSTTDSINTPWGVTDNVWELFGMTIDTQSLDLLVISCHKMVRSNDLGRN